MGTAGIDLEVEQEEKRDGATVAETLETQTSEHRMLSPSWRGRWYRLLSLLSHPLASARDGGEHVPPAGLGPLDDTGYWESSIQNGKIVLVNSDEEELYLDSNGGKLFPPPVPETSPQELWSGSPTPA
eukprot:749092-Hanusia_phi.AAC.1